MFIPLILNKVEKLINHYLQLDPRSAARLSALEGKVLVFCFDKLQWRVYWRFNGQQVELRDRYEGIVDVTISGLPSDFLRMMRWDSHSQMVGSSITINGNIETAQKFKALFSDLDIDWEEQVSHYTGDQVAYQLGQASRAFLNWFKQVAATMNTNISEYLQEEARLIPTQVELQSFLWEIDELRDDSERLQQRFAHLEQQLTKI